MLVNPCCVGVCPHFIPDCMQIRAHATHQFACQGEQNGPSIIDGCWSAETERQREICVFEVSCVIY